MPFKNQYLLCSQTPDYHLKDIQTLNWAGYTLYHNTKVFTSASAKTNATMIIGLVVNPSQPSENGEDIAQHLSENCKVVEDLIKHSQSLTGRFVIFQRYEREIYAVGDACHLKQIYFGKIEGSTVITSSEKFCSTLFPQHTFLRDESKILSASRNFLKSEHSWFGNDGMLSGMSKLLPNHHLNVNALKSIRSPIFNLYKDRSSDEIIEFFGNKLIATYATLTKQYRLIQPLTAGWDSRILLASSLSYKNKIDYYVFDGEEVDKQDINLPCQLSKLFDLRLKVITPTELEDRFVSEYKKEHLVPRLLKKHKFVQYHYQQNYQDNVINVNGNVAEIFRNFYGFSLIRPGTSVLAKISGAFYSKYFQEKISTWAEEAGGFAKAQGIPIQDLFYWEQRMGNWGARYPAESDIALEEISPFNNKELILAMLQIPSANRSSPNYRAIKKLITSMSPESMQVEINPNDNKLKLLLKRYTFALWLAKNVKNHLT